MEKRNKPEILAPAGTAEAMKAAVNAGCDAVYMGGSLFSARAYAGNFGTEEMVSSIDYCHLFGVKTYMTVNTLFKESETGLLKEYMMPFYEAGLDGVIVQDLGAAALLREEFPKLHVHASTQLSISSEYGARLMKRLGMTRIVPSRELSLEEIKAIREHVDIEIETFVHGAMCYAYSGKCLFSSFFGGRSGNRGRCAQPCRQQYAVCGKESSKTGPYIMSLKDMCTLSVLPRLINAGIDSFKIEGRMKNPYYVAAVTDAYRQARDKYLELTAQAGLSGAGTAGGNGFADEASQREYEELARQLTFEQKDIYNRGGFHTGYYFTDKGLVMTADTRPNHEGVKIGRIVKVAAPLVNIKLSEDVHVKDILEIRETGTELTSNSAAKKGSVLTLNGKELKKIKPGMEVFRTRNNSLIDSIDAELIRPERKRHGYAYIYAKIAEPLRIVVSDHELPSSGNTGNSGGSGDRDAQGVFITASGNTVEKADRSPVTAKDLVSRMNKTGGTGLELSVKCEADPDAFVAMSDFNNTRRAAMEQYRQAICSRYHRAYE